ncbi:MAG: anti-sigma factor antagonist [Streptosporangiaceae bacterium]|jgi:anti-sigma B factor antagonist|nr:Anti-anti-sigma factor BldG [Streptosporangiaceae bacterium]MDX6433439.1 anti-sigma factor antagonist [Streptosporangiaceae bacterium]
MALHLSSHILDDRVIIQVGGEIDVATSPELDEYLKLVMNQSRPNLVLDFSRVTLLCASGLTTLLMAQREARLLGGSLLVVAAQGIVARVFRITGLDEGFGLRPTVAEALAVSVPAGTGELRS